MRRTFGDALDFVIVREIAQGGMGRVYEALQCGVQGFSKRVALKVLRPEISRRPDIRELFVAEAHLVADLVHENIVQIYHLGEMPVDPDDEEDKAEGGEPMKRLFFAMELIDGLPLHAITDRHRARGTRFPIELASFIASRVCRALDYAHTRTDAFGEPLGIVHRDVCPANILIARGGVVKLSDFGVAKARFRTTMNQIPDGEGAVLVGRARYMSPEAARFEPTDPRSDVFSIGVVLYEMLAGIDAFRGAPEPAAPGAAPGASTSTSTKGRVRSMLPLRMVNKDVPERVDAMVTRALERDPTKRWPSAGAMGLELEKYIYEKGYGPTNLTLAEHLCAMFPDPKEVVPTPAS